MTKSEIARAIDSIVNPVVHPSLSERGFKKKRIHWWSASAQSIRVVTAYQFRSNYGSQGAFRMEFGVSYPGLGENQSVPPEAADCSHSNMFVVPGQDTWDLDLADRSSLSVVAAKFASEWSSTLLQFVDLIDDPRRYRDHLLGFDQSVRALLEAADLSNSLSGRDEERIAIERAMDTLRADPGVPERDRAHNPHPLHFLVNPYALLIERVERIGWKLEGDDRAKVLAVLKDCELLNAEDQFELHPAHSQFLYRIGNHVGIDVTGLAESGMRRYREILDPHGWPSRRARAADAAAIDSE